MQIFSSFLGYRRKKLVDYIDLISVLCRLPGKEGGENLASLGFLLFSVSDGLSSKISG